MQFGVRSGFRRSCFRLFALSLLLSGGAARAGSGLPDATRARAPGATPEIAIIIDDMGRSREEGERVIALPGPVACSFLPYEDFTRQLADEANLSAKEVMLHQPMQTVSVRPLDRGGMTLDMDEVQFRTQLQANLARVPHVIGINNHMGSLLTQHPGDMLWLMRAIRDAGGLFFVDSRTTVKTVARQIAYEQGIPSVSRDVFLDDALDEAAIRAQWDRLIKLARQQGSALAIGHPHPKTLRVLEEKLANLKQEQVKLVPVSELVKQQYARDTSWQLSSSH